MTTIKYCSQKHFFSPFPFSAAVLALSAGSSTLQLLDPGSMSDSLPPHRTKKGYELDTGPDERDCAAESPHSLSSSIQVAEDEIPLMEDGDILE